MGERVWCDTEQIQRNAVKIKRKNFWENVRMKIIIWGILALVVIILLMRIFS